MSEEERGESISLLCKVAGMMQEPATFEFGTAIKGRYRLWGGSQSVKLCSVDELNKMACEIQLTQRIQKWINKNKGSSAQLH